MGGGKTAQSSSQIQIPPEVLARYNAVNARAETAAETPFKSYSNDPNAFVAPVNAQQQSGIAGVNAAANSYQPYYDNAYSALGAARDSSQPLQNAAAGNITGGQQTGSNYLGAATNLAAGALGAAGGYNGAASSLIGQSAGAVNPTALGAAQIGQFMNPYNENVVQSTMANLRQQQQQEQSGEVGNQIRAHAFGGDRGGIAQANLARQQDLASGQVLSGLYSQNYQQALGAAQQQQGVNLGAAQSNRQALGAAGQNYASLGQQVYGQQSGTAGQIADLGNQGYTQALGAANAQAALGQQNYSQNMGYSQAQQGLGTARQQAGLSGAQAQIGAGTLQQQTTQAGQSAMYNQFLQQQGYPFQVAQFLAGIAEGTGSLSGSTTTNTAPASFLSDERAKEDIEPIGKTFDGQPIYKYRYKGQKAKQIGLVAQDVEQHHPDAVTDDGGLKYVDYDRATADAAERGHFADGGGVSGDTMAEVLRIQKAMYPWGAEGQGRTGGGSGPWGSALAQPGALKLAVSEAPKLNQESALHEIAGAVGDATDVADAGKDLYDKWDKKKDTDTLKSAVADGQMYRGGLVRSRAAGGGTPYAEGESYVPEADKTEHKLVTSEAPAIKGGGLLGTLKDIASIGKNVASFMYRGGVVPAYAGGGYVPEADDNQHTLATSKAPEIKGGGLLGTLKDVASIGKDVASFMNRGGLVPAYAEGGGVDDPDDFINEQASLRRASMERGLRDLPAPQQDAGPRRGGLGGLGRDLSQLGSGFGSAISGVRDWAYTQAHKPSPGVDNNPDEVYTGMRPEPQTLTQERAQLQAAQAPQPALGAAQTQPKQPSPIQNAGNITMRPEPKTINEQELEAPGLGGAAAPGPDKQPLDVASLRGDNKEPMPKEQEKRPGWFARNQDWVVPLLKGVGAAGASQSRFLPVALMQGAGAAAGSYEEVQNQLQAREAKAAETNEAYQRILPAALRGWMTVARDPVTGRVKTNSAGTPLYTTPDFGGGDQPAAGGAQQAQSKYVSYYDPDKGTFIYDIGPSESTDKRMQAMGLKYDPNASQTQRLVNAKRAIAMSSNADQEAVSEKNYAERRTALPDIENQHKQLLLMADQMLKQPQDGLAAPGAGHALAANAVGMINWAARAMGIPPPSGLDETTLSKFNDAEIADQIMTKVAAWTGSQAANIQGQHSMHIADVLTRNLPNSLMNPEAQREMMSTLLRASQMDRDIVKYGEQQKNKYATLLNYENNFKEDMGGELDKEHNVITGWMRHPDPNNPINPAKPKQSLFEYLMENRDRFTSDDKLILAKKFGPAALRWLDIH